MKPAPFRYLAPTTIEEALAHLAEHGYDAKILAGGQSLVPTMNFRLSQPAVLVDLNKIEALAYIRTDGAGNLCIGAMTRQSQVERSDLVARHAPLLYATMPFIAHGQIRNRGTIGGSLAHADPAAELPAVAVALDARFRIRNSQADRTVAATDFYIGLFTTDLAPDDILTEIVIPPRPHRSGWAVDEVARRHGDYAIVGCAAAVSVDDTGACDGARLVYFSVGEMPVVAQAACAHLVGAPPTSERVAEAAALAAEQDIEPTGDIHATVAYRRHLAGVLGRRVLGRAFAEAQASNREASSA